MKKCASCSKDLPEAALHCVFCGAKQAPAPAVPPSPVAKTAFGYSANEVMQQLGPGQSYQAPTPHSPSPQPYPPQRMTPPPTPYQPPRPHSPSPQPYPPPPPTAAATAATMMADPRAAPAQGYSNPSAGYSPPAQYGAPDPYGAPQPYGAPSAIPYTPASQALGSSSPGAAWDKLAAAPPSPYLGAQTGAAQSGRPIEPWRDSLKLMMFVWGVLLLAAFATPMSTDPLDFHWNAIFHGAGSAKIPPIVWAAVGVLAIVLAAIPVGVLPRGALAAVLGLAGIMVPMALGDLPSWKVLVTLAGMLVLVSGLLVRHEYTYSILPRVLVTIGVLCVLAQFLIPDQGQIPLVNLFKALKDAPGKEKVPYILEIVLIVLAVLCLLAWMPGPASAAGKLLAWALLIYPVALFIVNLVMAGNIAEVASTAPGKLLVWTEPVAYSVLLGYGVATVVGKQLE